MLIDALGIGIALQSRLAPFISQPDLHTDVQPRSIRVLSVPDYYAEYRDTGEGLAAFLGSSIVAKVSSMECISWTKMKLNSGISDNVQRDCGEELRD